MTLKYNQLADALAKLKFPEQGSDPSAYPNDGYLYSKDVAGKTELHYMDDSGAVTQVTSGGHLDLASTPASGDLSGTFPAPTVAKLQGKPVSPAPLLDGYVYVWNASASALSPQIQDGYWLQGNALPSKTANGFLKRNSGNTAWEAVIYGTGSNTVCQGNDGRLSDSRAPTGAASGDLSGTYPSPGVAKIQGKPVSPAPIPDGYVYAWNGVAGMLSPQIQDGYRLQNRAVANIAPLDGYLLQWNAGLNQWQPGTVGAGRGMTGGIVTPPLDTLTLLGLMSTTGLSDGTLAYVRNVDDIYYLKRTGSYTADGYDVINASGGGYWVSRTQGRWDDMQGDISQGTGAAALTYEAFRDTPWNLYCLRHDQDDSLSMRFQFSHKWRPGTAVFPHIHVLPLADPVSTQQVYFDGYYVWTEADNPANPMPALSGWTRVTKYLAVDPGNINVQRYVDLGPITPPSWAKESSILLFYIRRSGTSPGDTYTTNKTGGTPAANLGLLSFDVHYRANKMGTLPQIPT